MTLTIGYVVSSEINPDSSGETTLITPDCVQIRVWTDSVQQVGDYYAGQAGRHGRHTSYALSLADKAAINQAHMAFVASVKPVTDLQDKLKKAQASADKQAELLQSERDAAGWSLIGAAGSGIMLTTAGLAMFNPFMICSGLGGLCATPTFASRAEHLSQQIKDITEYTCAIQQDLVAAKQQLARRKDLFMSVFEAAAQRARLQACYDRS